MDHKFEELKCYFNTRLAEQEEIELQCLKKISKDIENKGNKQCKHI